MSTPKIVAAAAAAVLSTSSLTTDEKSALNDARYFVHPHVTEIFAGDAALTSYIENIYNGRGKAPLRVDMPKSAAFRNLRSKNELVEATRAAADNLATAMQSRTANPGIVFGFLLEMEGRKRAHGLIKADLDDEQRFFMAITPDNEWSIKEVQDILPAPAQQFAKFAIAPNPSGVGAAGIHDTQSGPDAAAGYFLESLGVVVPKTRNTQRDVANAAKRAGYEEGYTRTELNKITEDKPVEEVFDESFPDVSAEERSRVRGSDSRPLSDVLADDPFLTTYSTTSPRFELKVDSTVTVAISGRTITITLPEGHDDIGRRYDAP